MIVIKWAKTVLTLRWRDGDKSSMASILSGVQRRDNGVVLKNILAYRLPLGCENFAEKTFLADF